MVDQPGEMFVASQSGRTGPFGQAAAGALAPVAGKVEQVRRDAAVGGVHLDPDAADALIKKIGELTARANQLVTDCTDLDQPLRFGDNWVGAIMASRLREVATGSDHGVTPVLNEFVNVLSALEVAVRVAAGRYVLADDEARRQMESAVRILGGWGQR